ncbi:MAG: hypothetical protein ACK500_02505 [Flavobacteriales bacterium]|jgi:hypothetical protein
MNHNWPPFEAVFFMFKTQEETMAPNEEIDVRSQLAVMQAQIQTLTKTVDLLMEEVKILTALANQGKGSLRTLLIVGGLWTGLVAFLSFAAGHLTWK